jgi:hypothetical protein
MRSKVVGHDYQLIRADCRVCLDDGRVPWGSVAAVITDPPYGRSLRNNGRTGTRPLTSSHRPGGNIRGDRDWTIAGDRDQSLAVEVATWLDGKKICSAFFCSPYSPLPGVWRNILAWDKGGAVGAGGDPGTCWMRTFELVYVRHNRRLNGSRDQGILRYPVSPNFRKDFQYHPAQKPVPLLKYLVEKLTQPGELVVDPFMGSASTCVACLETGRKFIGIEVDPTVFAVAVERVDAHLHGR